MEIVILQTWVGTLWLESKRVALCKEAQMGHLHHCKLPITDVASTHRGAGVADMLWYFAGLFKAAELKWSSLTSLFPISGKILTERKRLKCCARGAWLKQSLGCSTDEKKQVKIDKHDPLTTLYTTTEGISQEE